MILRLKEKLVSLNVFYAGMHWRKRQKLVDKWHKLVIAECHLQGFKQFTEPVEINFFFPDSTKIDLDNLSATEKLIIDSFVKLRIIQDDSKKYIKKLTKEFYGEGEILILIKTV